MESGSPAPPATQKRDVVVMFTDIVDFTAYCDAHGEEGSLQLVQRHEDLVSPIIAAHGGTFVKTIGDAVMAYFLDVPEAALATQEIMKAVEQDNVGKTGDEVIHLRAALNLGPVVITKNNDLFGDTVNLASRMMGVGQPDQIMISRTIIDALGDNPNFICRFVGEADFKGKTGKVELYELLTKLLELKEKAKSKIVSDVPGSAGSSPVAPKDKLIGGKYFIEKLIGEGAYGRVYKARSAVDGKIVAIKVLPEDAYVFYTREAQVLRQLQPCPYVMDIIDAMVDPQGLCIVMPYVEHGSLQSYLNKLQGNPLEPGQIVSLMEELLLAIAHAHSKEVIHRDVKPQNILLRSGMDSILTDFGVAYAVESTGRSSTTTAGTSGYIAPEVVSGRFDNTIDIYSCGVVLYKMLGGEFPLDINTLSPATHPEFKKIIERSTAPRNKRYSQATEMLDDIRKVGAKIIAPTIQNIAQTGDERLLVAVTPNTWKLLEGPFAGMKVNLLQSTISELVKKVHWHVPAVTVVDFLAVAGSNTDSTTIVRACVALGTRVIVVNCPSEAEARPLLKHGAADCLASLEIPGAADALKSSIETVLTQVQMGGGSWWKRILG